MAQRSIRDTADSRERDFKVMKSTPFTQRIENKIEMFQKISSEIILIKKICGSIF